MAAVEQPGNSARPDARPEDPAIDEEDVMIAFTQLEPTTDDPGPVVTGEYDVVGASAHAAVGPLALDLVDVDGSVSIGADRAALDVTARFDRRPPSFDHELGPLGAFPGLRVDALTASWSGTRGLALGSLAIVGLRKPVVLELAVTGYRVDPFADTELRLDVRADVDVAAWDLGTGRGSLVLRLRLAPTPDLAGALTALVAAA